VLSISRCLILLTAGFPYGTDEPFLESELPYLADKFEKIFIFAVDAPPGSQATREIPTNAKHFNLARHGKKASRILDLAGAIMKPPANKGAYREECEEATAGFKRKLFLAYFEKRSAHITARCRVILDGLGLESFETVVVYSYWLFITARAASLLKEPLLQRCGTVRFYSRAHGYDIYDFRNSLGYLPMRRQILNVADAVFPCSNHGTRYLCEKYPSFCEKISTSYLGTLDYGLGPATPGGLVHLISCSRIVPLKRIERIASSLALLANRGLNLKWTHIGGGKGLPKLKKTVAASLGFMECEFTGTIPNKAVAAFYTNHPIFLFINVSSSEGLPVSIMEAASFGIPAVATDVGGTSEIVLDAVTGKLLRQDFTDADLASAIEGFAAMSTADYEAMRARTRAAWQAKFDAAANYAAFGVMIAGDGFENQKPGD